MRYLVTGAHGFIGSWLTSEIEHQGDQVVAIPRDMLVGKGLKAFIHSQKPDYIIHAGAYGNMGNQQDEHQIYESNVWGTWNLLTACNEMPYKGFINISSSSVYGAKFQPMNEYDSLNTSTFYGASKVSGEYFARAFATKYDKPIVNTRLFSIYGEGEAEFRFIPTVIRSIVTGEEMVLKTTPPHDWLYISDAVTMMLGIMKHAKILKGESVNLGTGRQTENGDIVTMLQEISGKKANITKIVEGDNHEWVMGKSIIHEFGLQHKTEIYEGLKKCFDYYKDKYAVSKRT